MFTLVWYIRILLPGNCYGVMANTMLGRVMNRSVHIVQHCPG
jgi:hypothetical protein